MRLTRVTGGLLLGVLLISANASAQDRRDAARRALDKADSARQARDNVRDSARLRSAAEVKRQRQEVQRDRQQATDDARLGVPAAERTPPTTPGTTIAPATPAVSASDSARAAATNRPGVLRIVASPTDSARESPPPLSRPRAFVMRLSKRDDAPLYCQNGSGHPMFGRDWCWQRGFRLGPEWRRERIRNAPLNRSSRATPIDRAQLEQMLGAELLERIEDGRTELQLEEPLSGNWVESPTGGLVLRIQAGDQPIAEVVDRNRDGTIDSLWRRVRR